MTLTINNPAIYTPTVNVTAGTENVPSSSTPGVYFDTEITTEESTGTLKSYYLNISPVANTPYEVENGTPSVCDITQLPIVSHVSVGQGIINITTRSAKKTVILDFPNSGSFSFRRPTGAVDGSYLAFCVDTLGPLADSSQDLNLFSGAINAGAYNPSCWASDFDFTGVSIWNSQSNDGRQAGTAITRRHIALAWHYRLNVGTVARFATGSEIVERTVIGVNRDTVNPSSEINSNPAVGDRCVCVLSADLPEGICDYPLVGDWFVQPDTQGVYYGYAGVHLTQNRKVSATFWPQVDPTYPSPGYSGTAYGVPVSTPIQEIAAGKVSGDSFNMVPGAFIDRFKDHYVSVVSGDSGCPIFVPVSAYSLALVSTFTAIGQGPLWYEDIANACIADADADAIARGNMATPTGYTVTVAADPTS